MQERQYPVIIPNVQISVQQTGFLLRMVLQRKQPEQYLIFLNFRNHSFKMQQKEEQATLEEDTLRYKLLPLVRTDVPANLIPLQLIEVLLQIIPYLQILRFSIDFFTKDWLGRSQSFFSYLDLSYYLNLAGAQTFNIVLVVSLTFMNLYWIIHVLIFLAGKTLSNAQSNARKMVFMVTKNVLLLPLLNVVIDAYNCNIEVASRNTYFRTCFTDYSTQILAVAILSFALFFLFLAAQTFFNFQFLPNKKQYRRIRRSCFTSIALMSCLIINQSVAYFLPDLMQLIVLDISSLLLAILILLKDEQINERVKLIQLSFLGVFGLSILMLNILHFTTQNLSVQLFFVLSLLLAAGVMQVETYSLQFQLQNINKWPTVDIMIRYTNTLRYYLSRRDQQIFLVYIHGYMEVHRQKCDNPRCASRKIFVIDRTSMTKTEEQLIRCENLVKEIFADGYRLTPINAQLQLQHATFLYELGEKECALKNLLLIKYQELSFDKYYRYSLLKERIHKEMMEEPNKQFLDLVSELHVKREEQEMLKKLEKAALVNLQFWSVLNQDHPDFQKLNQIGAKRIQIRREVKENYELICGIAHSEKVTSLFVNYLQTIENDEAMYNSILSNVKEEYGLNEKIVLQDWANTSNAIILVSIEIANYGTIIDVNSSCASLFGYERYEILNRVIEVLFLSELQEEITTFLSPFNFNQTFYLVHKTGYILKIKRQAQNYNSMQTGMAVIITINLELAPNTCSFVVADSGKLIGISASTVPLLGLELKCLEGDVTVDNFFSFRIDQLPTMVHQSNTNYQIKNIIKQQFQNEIVDYVGSAFRLSYEKCNYCTAIELKSQNPKYRSKQKPININFEFQVQATPNSFAYLGNFSKNESYITQFSQLNYADSLRQDNTAKDYSVGISTLRLRENIIQVIEQSEEEQGSKFEGRGAVQAGELEDIPRKDEEEMFQSKSAFESFIANYTLAKYINLLLLISMIALLAMYIAYSLIFVQHNTTIKNFTEQIAYQNLIIGAVTKQFSLMQTLAQMAANQSNDTPPRFTSIYTDNVQYLQNIKLKGSSPYYMDVSLGKSSQTFLTDQFLLSFISYSLAVFGSMSANMTTAQLVNIYKAADPYAVTFLTSNSVIVKQTMLAKAALRDSDLANTINNYINIEVVMLVLGILFVMIIAIATLLTIHHINLERIKIFQIFLDVTEIQIQRFSSKSQKFLMSLHLEDTNGEIDVDEEIENAKKINSSTFAKKKRFKLIKFNKFIYLKLLFIPLCASAFFIHSFVVSYLNLQFQADAHHYFYQTSVGDYQFFSGLAKVQQALLTNSPLPTSLSQTYLLYYHEYFGLHYNTFGYIDDFHEAFVDIFMTDICNGSSTPYGSSKIPQSCEVPLLYPNGSYMVFTDTAMRTEYLTNSSSLSYSHLVGYEVLSKTHRLLTQNLLQAQSKLINCTLSNLMTCLFIWILVMSVVATLYGIPIMKRFVQEINEIKNILSILPISVAKQLPLATRYFNQILRSKNCC